MDIMKKNEAVSKEFLDWIVAETRALNSSEWNIFGTCKLSFARDGRTILLLEAITISWSWSRFVSYRRRNIGPFQFYEKRLKVAEMIQPTLTKMTWALNKATNVLKANRDISGAINWRLCGRLESGVQLGLITIQVQHNKVVARKSAQQAEHGTRSIHLSTPPLPSFLAPLLGCNHQ